MAIYHLEAKAVSRGSGRSAVAAAAYMSCSEIHNEYDGVTHDFTRKRGLVWQQVFLPKNAPPEWKDRNVLWNAVEAAEKSKDSRLARELVVALPIELDKTQWVKLLTEYIQENFVAEGMCADVAIHDTRQRQMAKQDRKRISLCQKRRRKRLHFFGICIGKIGRLGEAISIFCR